MLYGRDLIANHISCTVGNGESIDLFLDRWIPNSPPLNHILPATGPTQLKLSSILNLTENSISWNLPKIRDFFPHEVIPKILSIHLPFEPLANIRIWPHTRLRVTIIQNQGIGVCMTAKRNSLDIPAVPPNLHKGVHVWKIIWHLDLPERLKVFIWKCVKGILAVKKGLSSRMHHLSPICPLCASDEESITHLFLQCPLTVPVWAGTPFLTAPVDQAADFSFKNWLLDWILQLTASTTDLDTFRHFIAILWAIWKTRNEQVFPARPFACLSRGS